jgi:hypothetical protein
MGMTDECPMSFSLTDFIAYSAMFSRVSGAAPEAEKMHFYKFS